MADSTLRILPYATMQMYSTYTAELDAYAANSYTSTSANAPQFIVIDTLNLSIDSKNAFIDSPRTWAAIRANYSIREKTADGRWILLERRSFPRPISLTRKITVPSATLFEKLVALLFRGRLRFVEIETLSGTEQTFRVNPLVLKDPIDRDLPLDVKDLAGYFSQPSSVPIEQ